MSRNPSPQETAKGDAVWRMLESEPGFNARLRAAEAELAAGGGERYEVRDGELWPVTGGRRMTSGVSLRLASLRPRRDLVAAAVALLALAALLVLAFAVRLA